MKDTDRIIEQLRDLPPDLMDPVDRFEQIGARVRRTRRRHSVVGGVVGVAVFALAVPLATQLLPETAEVGPGGGGVVATADPSEPVTNDANVMPGGTRVTHLSEPITVTKAGTTTVELGEKPTGATGVAMVLDCLSAGEFTYPDGASMICDASDAREESVTEEDFVVAPYVIDLAEGTDTIEIRAADGARWQVTTAYVSTEVTEWGVNAKGQTYGVQNENGEPDLISAIATNGQTGYASVAEMNAAVGPEPTSPEHALKMQEERAGQTFSVPVYESDGETVIGEFVIGGATRGEGDVSTATATATATMAP
ncbi:hypothetical protein NF556_07315 [Ornithinimicrobium faecis]|uniref:DUF4179 domain-containing protein n=1 Tax=Ornithinimicrobium faecis TaxID=2934158 RepID=A0ABY4YXI3_9MICO|nr:hypothetical protein [Ornithinimicrobium sp. HY1793]USQ81449.1 hypothetical protein NF556_07315 [Ornithinimicrobium sp. HY1793]